MSDLQDVRAGMEHIAASKDKDMTLETYLIVKRGLYWNPNRQGYTMSKALAGRFNYEETMEITTKDTMSYALLEEVAPTWAPGASHMEIAQANLAQEEDGISNEPGQAPGM